MASEAAIKTAIEQVVAGRYAGSYSVWTIGVTDSPQRRRGEHGNPGIWHQWDADTEQAARNVEAYFLAKGMKGSGGGLGRADYVYIFI